MEKVLEVRNLTKTYSNQRGVKDVSFTIQPGDVFGFFGPNGAGKTTVMKIIAGLSRADHGEVKIFGYDNVNQFEQAMQKVGVIIENPVFYEYMSAYKHLKLAARFYPELETKRIDEVLELVGLLSVKHEKVKGFSTGMKQRLALAAALLSKPEFLMLDEPTNGLDIEGMIDFRNIIQHFAKEHQVTFLISSHLLKEMEPLCTRIGILYHGQLIQEGPAAELLADQGSIEQYFLSQISKVKGGQGIEEANCQYAQ